MLISYKINAQAVTYSIHTKFMMPFFRRIYYLSLSWQLLVGDQTLLYPQNEIDSDLVPYQTLQ